MENTKMMFNRGYSMEICSKSRVLASVFSDRYESLWRRRKILDPRGTAIHKWNIMFLTSCFVALFIDPLFFISAVMRRRQKCVDFGVSVQLALAAVRSAADAFYAFQIFVRFHTAYVAPSSLVFGTGDLVVNRAMIASRYLRSGFFLDLIAALPLPQVLMGVTWPSSFHRRTKFKNASRFTVLIQYIPRMYLALRLSSDIVKSAGVVTVRSWPGAFYNLLLYMLASHVVGTLWYLMAVDNQETCWRKVCGLESPACRPVFLDCRSLADEGRLAWVKSSNITRRCTPRSGFYTFGIFGDALKSGVTSASFLEKYFYCLWWGLRNLSSLGQGMLTSTNVGEIIFAIVVSTMGLVLFSLLIGNMQRYLQSATLRLEEWRIKRTDIEEWMRHRQLPEHLQISVRKYDHCKWIATRGVDEESLLTSLPMDLRRDIKRHLCYDLLLRVPLFEQLDERTLDAICERLKPGVRTEGTYLVREGDPVHEMLFIVRGRLDSTTTNGGRSGFFNICKIGPGDFCGEELLTWALQHRPSPVFPSSTRTVCSLSEVETFALCADDLAFVTTQFRHLHSKQLRHRLRFYSHQWRTWAACFIQAAWRRLIRRRCTTILSARDDGVTEVAITTVIEPLPNSTTLMKPKEVDFSGGQ